VHTWLHAQLKPFFADGIGKLMDWSNKFVEKVGDYVKKIVYFYGVPLKKSDKLPFLNSPCTCRRDY
jgi:hypothetical protein